MTTNEQDEVVKTASLQADAGETQQSTGTETKSGPMMPWLYTCLFLPGFLTVREITRGYAGIFCPSNLIALLAVALFVHAAWKNLDAGPKRLRPFLAAALLFVPYLALVWTYWAIYPLGKAIKADAEKYGLRDEVGDTFSRTWCHLSVATPLLIILVLVLFGMTKLPTPFSFPLLPLSAIAAVLFVLWLTLLHVMFFHYSRLINAIVAARAAQAHAEPATQVDRRSV